MNTAKYQRKFKLGITLLIIALCMSLTCTIVIRTGLLDLFNNDTGFGSIAEICCALLAISAFLCGIIGLVLTIMNNSFSTSDTDK